MISLHKHTHTQSTFTKQFLPTHEKQTKDNIYSIVAVLGSAMLLTAQGNSQPTAKIPLNSQHAFHQRFS
jgi:hypothetical protein